MKNEFKIAILYCNSDEEELDGNDAAVVPTLGAAYIAATLKNKNFQVDYYDCPIMGLSTDELIEILKNNEYQAVGVSVYAYNYKNSIKVTTIIKVIPYNGTPLYEFYEKSNLLNRNDSVNTDVNEWYNYLLRWIERLKKCYNEINGIGLVPTSSKRKILVEFHKLDVEYWARSLDMVKNGKNDNCCGLIEEQFEKVKKIMLGNFENF